MEKLTDEQVKKLTPEDIRNMSLEQLISMPTEQFCLLSEDARHMCQKICLMNYTPEVSREQFIKEAPKYGATKEDVAYWIAIGDKNDENFKKIFGLTHRTYNYSNPLKIYKDKMPIE